MSGGQFAFERIQRSAIGAARFAGFFDRDIYARMGIPQAHVRGRAVQRQVFCGYFNMALRIVSGLHGVSFKRGPASRHIFRSCR